MKVIRRFVNTILRRRRRLEEIEEELSYHLDQRREALMQSGLSPHTAAREATILFGNPASLRDRVDRAETSQWLGDLLRDIRIAGRSLKRRTALSLTVISSLGISIAATTALFGFVDALQLRPVALPHPENVITLQETFNGQPVGSNPPRLHDWAVQVPGLEHVGGTYSEETIYSGDGSPTQVITLRTVGDMMGIFGEPPSQGRAFTAQESEGNGANVALISDRFYRQRFTTQGKPDAVGGTVQLNQTPYTIIGILAPNRAFPPDVDVVTPAPMSVQNTGRQAGFLTLFGRVRPGVTLAELQQQLDTVNRRLVRAYPSSDSDHGVRAQRVRELFGQSVRRSILLLFCAALLLLLLADLNVATLLLTRATERGHEAAIRLAIGAGRGALIRLYLCESLLLASAGGLFGIALGRVLFSLLLRMLPNNTSLPIQPVFDWRIALFGTVAALLSGLLFGIMPALKSSATGRDGLTLSRQTSNRANLRWRHLLVGMQVALSMLLLMGVGLTARSLYLDRTEPVGFDPAQVVSASVAYPWDTPAAKLRTATASSLEALAREPAVISSGLIDRLPLNGNTQTNSIGIEGRPLSAELESLPVAKRAFNGDYFATMGIPLLAGRLPRPQASEDSPEIVVNNSFARRFFPAGDALGQRIFDREDKGKTDNRLFHRIVGIVGNTRVETNQRAEPPETFLLSQNTFWPMLNYVAKLRSAEPFALARVRAAVQQSNPEQIVTGPIPLISTMAEASSGEQNRLTLLALFAGSALLLSCVGIYGVLSGEVTRSTREIGIRLALGASRFKVIAGMFRTGLLITAYGLLAGSLLSLGAGRLLGSLLFAIEPTDLFTWTVVVFTLLLVSMAAIYLPARRAASVQPTEALRME